LGRSAPIGIHSMRGEPVGTAPFFDDAEAFTAVIATSVINS
jgi:hypothetical protein